MGMFDSLYVPCPHCGTPVEFQSKAWDRNLDRYTLDDAPLAVLTDVMNEPKHCRACDRWLALIDPAYPPEKPWRPSLEVRKVRQPENPQTHHQGFKWWPCGLGFSSADLIDKDEGR